MTERKTLTVEIVKEKALQMAIENGLDSVSYNGLARALDIRPQSLYRYIANIKELRLIMLETFLSELVDSLASISSIEDPKEALYRFAVLLYDECHTKPWYYQSFNLMHEADLVKELSEPLHRMTDLIHKKMQLIQGDQSEYLTQSFLAVNIGFAHMASIPGIPFGAEGDRLHYCNFIRSFIEKML